MLSRVALPSLRTARCAVLPHSRSYASAPSSASSNLAPILIGLGMLGAGGFYYSTRGQDVESIKAKAKAMGKVEEIEGKAKEMVAGVGMGSGAKAALNKDEFRNFKLEKVIPYNHNSSRFVFKLPEGTDSGLTIASALVVKSAKDDVKQDGKPVIRPYTPTTAPGTVGYLELLVKKYKGGAMTEHIFSLKPGEELGFKGPIPKFPWKANQFESVALVAGGSGITPMWQILQKIDTDPTDKTKATLIFGNVGEEDILLREEFDDLAKRKPEQFKIVYVIDKPGKNWKGEKGYITHELLSKNLPPAGLGERIKIFVCGPPGQMAAISGTKKSPSDQGELKGLLADNGYTESQVYKF